MTLTYSHSSGAMPGARNHTPWLSPLFFEGNVLINQQRQSAEVSRQNKEVKTLKLCLQNLSRNKFLEDDPGTDSLVKVANQSPPNREFCQCHGSGKPRQNFLSRLTFNVGLP